MDHPLAMDAEAMRRAGYATVDALVARLAVRPVFTARVPLSGPKRYVPAGMDTPQAYSLCLFRRPTGGARWP